MRRLLLALFLPALLGAAGVSTRVESIDSSRFPEVVTTVHVFTEDPAARLRPDDFLLSEDETPIQGFRVEVDPRPIYLSLVLDESGSMHAALAHLQRAAFDLVDTLDARVRTQLITFSDTVRSRTGFVRDSRLLKQRIAELKAEGATRLYDALDAAAQAVAPYPHEVRRLVLAFTDGRDGKKGLEGPLSARSPKEVARYAWVQGVPLYFVGMGQEVDQGLLGKLAAATGGEALFGADPASLKALFERMGKSLSVSYRIAYTSPRPAMDGSVRTLQVVSRLKGESDQGQGKYKAPSVPAESDRTPAQVAAGRGLAAYRKVLGTLRGLGAYRVVAASRVVGPPVEGGAAVEVESQVEVTHAADGAEAVRVSSLLGRQGLTVKVLRRGDVAHVEVGHKFGKPLVGRVDLSHAQGGEAATLRSPVRAVIGWLGGDAPGGEVPAPSDGSSFLFEAPNRIHLLAPGGQSTGVLTFDRQTFLPTHLVTVDLASGTSSRVEFRDWSTEGDLEVTLPEAAALAAGAEAFALRLASQALRTAGEAMRTAEVAVEAGAAGASAGLTAAATGVAVAQAGVEVAATAVRFAAPLTEASLRFTVRTLGGVSHLLGSPDFQQAVTGGLEGEYWDRYRGETGEAAYTQAFSSSAQEFGEAMVVWAEDLDRELEKSAAGYQVAMEAYAQSLDQAGAALDAAGAAVDSAAGALGAAGGALDAAQGALDAVGLGGTPGATPEGSTGVTEDEADSLDQLGEKMDALGDAMDQPGADLGALGAQMRELGRQMEQLGGS